MIALASQILLRMVQLRLRIVAVTYNCSLLIVGATPWRCFNILNTPYTSDW
jgi:hypothetical protein